MLFRLGDVDEAVRSFRRAAQREPFNTEVTVNLAVALATQGDHQAAVTLLRQAVASHPDHTLAWFNLGVTLEAMGNKAEAIQSYTEAIRLQPDSADARHRRQMLVSAGAGNRR